MHIDIVGLHSPEHERGRSVAATNHLGANFSQLMAKLRSRPSLKTYFELHRGSAIGLGNVTISPREDTPAVQIRLSWLPEHNEVRAAIVEMVENTVFAAFEGAADVLVYGPNDRSVPISARRCIDTQVA
ncbi:MAG: hypothetical protein AB202_01335 [Parcubacteria bacterium C7867-007]|nr:MAG: hypothetical protein AB202_01335 [Parcubacteria bacterium C7867-007]